MPLPRPPWRTFASPVSVTAAVVLAHAGALWALHNAWAPPATAPPEAVKVVVELRAQAPGAPPAAPAAEASSAPPRASAPAATAARALPERATRPEPPTPAAPQRPPASLLMPLSLPPASPNPSPALAAEPVQPLALALPVATAQAPAGAEANSHSPQGTAKPNSAGHDQRSSGVGALDTTAHAAAGRAPSGQGQAPAQIVPPSSSGAHLHNPAPPYPVLSRRLGEQGRVLLRVRIEADGSASAAQVYGSSGFARLDQAAQQAVLRWRFVPGTRNGEPQAMWHLVPIHFVLE